MDSLNEEWLKSDHRSQKPLLSNFSSTKLLPGKKGSSKLLKSVKTKKNLIINKPNLKNLEDDMQKPTSISPSRSKNLHPNNLSLGLPIPSIPGINSSLKKPARPPKSIKTEKNKTGKKFAFDLTLAKKDAKHEDKKNKSKDRDDIRRLSCNGRKSIDLKITKAINLDKSIKGETKDIEDLKKEPRSRKSSKKNIDLNKTVRSEKKVKAEIVKLLKNNESKKEKKDLKGKPDLIEKLTKTGKQRNKGKNKSTKEKVVMKCIKKKKIKYEENKVRSESTQSNKPNEVAIFKRNRAVVIIQRWFRAYLDRKWLDQFTESDYEELSDQRTDREEWVNILVPNFSGTNSAFVEEFKKEIQKNNLTVKKPVYEVEESIENGNFSNSESDEIGTLIIDNEQMTNNKKEQKFPIPKLTLAQLKNDDFTSDEDQSENYAYANQNGYPNYDSDESYDSVQLVESKPVQVKKVPNIKSLDLAKIKNYDFDSDDEYEEEEVSDEETSSDEEDQVEWIKNKISEIKIEENKVKNDKYVIPPFNPAKANEKKMLNNESSQNQGQNAEEEGKKLMDKKEENIKVSSIKTQGMKGPESDKNKVVSLEIEKSKDNFLSEQIANEIVIEKVIKIEKESIKDEKKIIPNTTLENLEKKIEKVSLKDEKKSIPNTTLENLEKKIEKVSLKDEKKSIPNTIIESLEKKIEKNMVESSINSYEKKINSFEKKCENLIKSQESIQVLSPTPSKKIDPKEQIQELKEKQIKVIPPIINAADKQLASANIPNCTNGPKNIIQEKKKNDLASLESPKNLIKPTLKIDDKEKKIEIKEIPEKVKEFSLKLTSSKSDVKENSSMIENKTEPSRKEPIKEPDQKNLLPIDSKQLITPLEPSKPLKVVASYKIEISRPDATEHNSSNKSNLNQDDSLGDESARSISEKSQNKKVQNLSPQASPRLTEPNISYPSNSKPKEETKKVFTSKFLETNVEPLSDRSKKLHEIAKITQKKLDQDSDFLSAHPILVIPEKPEIGEMILVKSPRKQEETSSKPSEIASLSCIVEEDIPEVISKLINSEIYSFLRIIPFKDTEREVDSSIEFIIEYLDIMAKELKQNEEEVLDAINTPAYQEPLQKLTSIQDFSSVLNKFPTLELILPPDLCSELKVFFHSLELPSRQIYLQMLFDCVNEALNYIRPFGVDGIPDPWSMKPRILFGEAELANVFSRIISYMVKWVSCRTGQLHGPESHNDDDRLMYIREERMSALLCMDAREEENGWLRYEEEEAQVKIITSNSILSSLIDEIINIIK